MKLCGGGDNGSSSEPGKANGPGKILVIFLTEINKRIIFDNVNYTVSFDWYDNVIRIICFLINRLKNQLLMS